jgi:hypothetical protein
MVHNQDMAKTRKPSAKKPEPSKRLVVDEDAFTEVIRNLANSPPVSGWGFERKKNPPDTETDPRKTRLFNLDGMRRKKR